ncbi:PAS domain S-box protein [Mucilaginibacter celer]|uniref:PAS domain S-box protein n=1 Tax=Mucilaginibacter celer TaxID=2305508 RepID=A0A494VRQ5_9SPHI|nr:PAS domain S-box protein [Mucilaginibacter celer]AYL97604.1 PAS domain S-box protein [Mucilaginibacter celer]
MNLPNLNDQVFNALCEQLSGEAIFVSDTCGIIKGWNSSAERFYGCRAENIVGCPLTHLFESFDYETAFQMASENSNYQTEAEVLQSKSSFVSRAEITIKALYDGDVLNGYSFYARQLHAAVDEPKKKNNPDANRLSQFENQEQAARELSAYKYALDEAAIVAVTDQTGRIVHVNEYFCRISGYSGDELIGKDHRLINSGYHEAKYIQNLWKTIANGKVWRGELCNRAKNGSIYWVATTIVPFLNSEGKPYQYVAIRYDITALKLADEELTRTNKEISDLLESINDGFAALDKDLRFTYINIRICEMFRKKREDLLGRSIWDAFPEYVESATFKAIRKAAGNHTAEITEEYYGQLNLWQETRIYPNENGLSIFVSDISDRKSIELQRILFHNISAIFNQQDEMSPSLRNVLAEILQFSKASLAEIWLTSAERGHLYQAAAVASDKLVADAFEINTAELLTPAGNGFAGSTWEYGDLQYIDNLQTSAKFIRRDAAQRVGLTSAICSPLRNNNEINGVILLAFEGPAPQFLTRVLFAQLGSHLGAEIKRKQLKRELQQIFESVPDMICTIGLDRSIKRVNRAMCDILGYDEKFLLNATIDQLIHPDDLEESKLRMKRFREGEIDTLHFENRYVTRTGALVHLNWTVKKSSEKGVLFAVGKEITEKKELAYLLTKASEMARIGSWEVNLANNMVFWSDIANQIVEMPPEHRPSRSDAEFFYDPETLKVVNSAMEKVASTGEPFDLEMELNTATHRKIWVRVQGEDEFKGGHCHKIYGSIQDIDKRKRAELEAKRFLEERNTILESIGDGFFSVDKNWRVSYWNRQAEEDFKVDKEQILHRDFWSCFPDAVNTVSFSELKTAMSTGHVRRFEAFSKIVGKWFDISVYPSNNGLSVFFKDISVRKQAEEQLAVQTQALALSEQRYSDLFQMSPLPKWVFDINTFEFLEVNQAAVLHYGYSRDEFLQMTIKDIRPESEIDKVQAVIADKSRKEFQCCAGVFTHLKKNGERIEAEITSSLLNYNGRAARLVLAIDVTERNRHIEEIQQQNKRLKDISWMQSHIIRGPLSRLMGLIYLMNETGPDESEIFTQITSYINESAKELDEVIHDIVKNADLNIIQ